MINSCFELRVLAGLTLECFLSVYSSIGKELDFTIPRISNSEGTSFTAPVLSGMVALVQELYFKRHNCYLNQEQMYRFLIDNSYDLGEKGHDIVFGLGIPILPEPHEVDLNKYIVKEGEKASRFKQYTVEQYLEVLKNTNITREITEVHMHHTWKPVIETYMELENKEDAIWSMWEYHTKTRKFIDIAQHATVAPDLTVWACRDVNISPASIKGHNENAFMFETIGNFDIPGTGDYNNLGYDRLEGDYLETVIKFIKGLLSIFKGAKLVFYNEHSDKTCPGTSIDKEVLLKMVEGNKHPSDLSEWTKDGYDFVKEAGISDGTRPKDTLTREEMWTMLHRYHNKYGK